MKDGNTTNLTVGRYTVIDSEFDGLDIYNY